MDPGRQESVCGHTHKPNRPSQAVFACGSCGFRANADHNAARNIWRGRGFRPRPFRPVGQGLLHGEGRFRGGPRRPVNRICRLLRQVYKSQTGRTRFRSDLDPHCQSSTARSVQVRDDTVTRGEHTTFRYSLGLYSAASNTGPSPTAPSSEPGTADRPAHRFPAGQSTTDMSRQLPGTCDPSCWTLLCTSTLPTDCSCSDFWRMQGSQQFAMTCLKRLLRANRCIGDGELHGPGHDLETGKQACSSIPEQPDCVRGRHRETGLCRLATADCCHCRQH